MADYAADNSHLKQFSGKVIDIQRQKIEGRDLISENSEDMILIMIAFIQSAIEHEWQKDLLHYKYILMLGSFPGVISQRSFSIRKFPKLTVAQKVSFPEGYFPDGQFPRRSVSQNFSFPEGQFPIRKFPRW